MKTKFNNEEAQIAVIFLFFIAVVFIGFYWMMMGGIMTDLTNIHNNLTQAPGTTALSQNRQDSLIFLQSTFNNIPIIAFILTIITVIILALANKYQVM